MNGRGIINLQCMTDNNLFLNQTIEQKKLCRISVEAYKKAIRNEFQQYLI